MRSFVKHLIECNCILPQFKAAMPPVFHKFIVFSELKEKSELLPSYVKCNNCGAIHRVYEVNKSELTKNENTRGVVSFDELKLSLPEKIVIILEKYECDITVWQEIMFLIENKIWGNEVVLSRETEETQQKKRTLITTLLIAGETLFKINKREKETDKNG